LDLEEFQKHLGYTFRDVSLLKTALSRGDSHESPLAGSLEHIGDAVVSLVVRDLLSRLYGDKKIYKYSQLVSNHTMSMIARKIPLQKASKQYSNYRYHLSKKSIANLLEALIGAIFQDGGFEPARDFIWEVFPFQAILVHDFTPPEIKGNKEAEKRLREFQFAKFLIKEAYEATPFQTSMDYHIERIQQKDVNASHALLLFEIDMAHKWDKFFMPNTLIGKLHKEQGRLPLLEHNAASL
jgi:dsRNA-specific ribonuclease